MNPIYDATLVDKGPQEVQMDAYLYSYPQWEKDLTITASYKFNVVIRGACSQNNNRLIAPKDTFETLKYLKGTVGGVKTFEYFHDTVSDALGMKLDGHPFCGPREYKVKITAFTKLQMLKDTILDRDSKAIDCGVNSPPVKPKIEYTKQIGPF